MPISLNTIAKDDFFAVHRTKMNSLISTVNYNLLEWDNNLSDVKDLPTVLSNLNVYGQDVLYTQSESDAKYYDKTILLSEYSDSPELIVGGETNAQLRRKQANNLDMYIKNDLYTKTETNDTFLIAGGDNVTGELTFNNTVRASFGNGQIYSIYSDGVDARFINNTPNSDSVWSATTGGSDIQTVMVMDSETDHTKMSFYYDNILQAYTDDGGFTVVGELGANIVTAQTSMNVNGDIVYHEGNVGTALSVNQLSGSGYTLIQADNQFLAKGSNLSDLNDLSTSRTNLNVYSQTEIDNAIDTTFIKTNLMSEVPLFSAIDRETLLTNLNVYSIQEIDSEFQTGASTYLTKNNNLSDLADDSIARNNLGLGNHVTFGFDDSTTISYNAGTTDAISRSDHSHNILPIVDNRTVTETPDDLKPSSLSFNYKQDSTLGLGNIPTSLSAVLNIVPGSSYDADNTQHQLALSADQNGGRIHHHIATSGSTWGAWETLAYLTDTVANSDLLEGQNLAYTLNWNNFTNLPSTFPADPHNHDLDYINVTGDTMTGELILADNNALVIGGASARTAAKQWWFGDYISGSDTGYSFLNNFSGNLTNTSHNWDMYASNGQNVVGSMNQVWSISQSGNVDLYGTTNHLSDVNVNNNNINGVNSVIFDAGPAVQGVSTSTTNIKSSDLNTNKLALYDGSNVQKGAMYGSTGVFGLLDNNDNWSIKHNNGVSTDFYISNNDHVSFVNDYTMDLRGLQAFDYSTSWLKINPNNAFSGGVTFDQSIIRTDNKIEIGANGSVLSADNSEFKYNGDDVLLQNLTHIQSPSGGQLLSFDATVTGAIKITLPVLWTSTMVKFYVDVYNYATDTSFTVFISGYNSSPWLSTTATIIGGQSYPVRFGEDGINNCIIIGDVSDTWRYPQILVRDFHSGFFNTGVNTWNDGWGVSHISTLSGVSVSSTHNNPALYGPNNRPVFLDGTVSGPSITFENDDNTGFFKTGTDAIGVTCGSVHQLSMTDGTDGILMLSDINVNGNTLKDVNTIDLSNGTEIISDSDIRTIHNSSGSSSSISIHSSGITNGHIYGSGNDIGILDAGDSWSLKISDNVNTTFRVSNIERFLIDPTIIKHTSQFGNMSIGVSGSSYCDFTTTALEYRFDSDLYISGAAAKITLNGKNSIQTNSTWLYLNGDSEHTSGTFTPSNIRADGGFEVGISGGTFKCNGSEHTYNGNQVLNEDYLYLSSGTHSINSGGNKIIRNTWTGAYTFNISAIVNFNIGDEIILNKDHGLSDFIINTNVNMLLPDGTGSTNHTVSSGVAGAVHLTKRSSSEWSIKILLNRV